MKFEEVSNPVTVASLSGLVLKLTMPLKAYLKELVKLNLEVPEYLFSTLYSKYLVLKPIQENIPLENLFISPKFNTASLAL